MSHQIQLLRVLFPWREGQKNKLVWGGKAEGGCSGHGDTGMVAPSPRVEGSIAQLCTETVLCLLCQCLFCLGKRLILATRPQCVSCAGAVIRWEETAMCRGAANAAGMLRFLGTGEDGTRGPQGQHGSSSSARLSSRAWGPRPKARLCLAQGPNGRDF